MSTMPKGNNVEHTSRKPLLTEHSILMISMCFYNDKILQQILASANSCLVISQWGYSSLVAFFIQSFDFLVHNKNLLRCLNLIMDKPWIISLYARAKYQSILLVSNNSSISEKICVNIHYQDTDELKLEKNL